MHTDIDLSDRIDERERGEGQRERVRTRRMRLAIQLTCVAVGSIGECARETERRAAFSCPPCCLNNVDGDEHRLFN
jgi:hypothetical protein